MQYKEWWFILEKLFRSFLLVKKMNEGENDLSYDLWREGYSTQEAFCKILNDRDY